MPVHLCSVCSCFHATVAELSRYKGCLACKTQDIYYLDLHRESLLTASLDDLSYCLALPSHSDFVWNILSLLPTLGPYDFLPAVHTLVPFLPILTIFSC